MKIKASFLIPVFLILSGLAAHAASPSYVSITVEERGGVQRANEYVSFGIPLPRDWNVTDVSTLRLSESGGAPTPARFEALARWGGPVDNGSAPVKWVLIGCFQSVAANGSRTLRLDREGPGPSPGAAIRIDESTPGKLTVDAGAAQFELNTAGDFNIIHQVTIGGRTLLQSLGAADAITYVPVGSVSIVPGGTPDSTPRVTTATVERRGALHAVVKVMGSILHGGSTPVLDFTARLHFFAGLSDVRLDFTVENNHPVIEAESGQPTNAHDQGAPNSVYIGGLTLSLRLKDAVGDLRVLTEEGVDATAPSSPVRLFQDSSGTDFWDAYVGQVGWEGSEASAAPRLQSYCVRQDFEITGPFASKTGRQAQGWMSAFFPSGPGVTAAVRDFWQNFPKAVETSTNGTISVDLFPEGSRFNHNLRVGEEKTHSILYRFGANPISADEAGRLSMAFNNPLFGVASPSWCVDSGALGETPAKNVYRWPLYERYVRVAFEPNPDVGPNDDAAGFGNTTLLDAIEMYNFYGWQDYGDVPLDYESFGPSQAGQMNLKYWFVHGMFLQFLRSGDHEWLDLALPAARHLSDIDYLHIPDNGIQHWAHGAYFGHSEHGEPGCIDPNRNVNSPSTDLLFGVPDLILGYHVTGERRFLDVALEGLEGMVNLSQFDDFTFPVFYRRRANLIFAYMEGYRQTGDAGWLNQMRSIVQPIADLSNKGWLTDPASYVPPPYGPEGDERISGFQFAQVLWTLGRYLDFCDEYLLEDDLGVAAALEAYGNFIIDHLMREITEKPGYYATISSIWFTADNETYQEVNNWALLMADVLAYAYKYSGKTEFLDAAAKLYQTGTIDQAWLDDAPVYIATKDLVNSCNWGLTYMNTLASSGCLSLTDDLGVSIPCFDLGGDRFGVTFDHSHGLVWEADAGSLSPAGGDECLTLGDGYDIQVPCFDLDGKRFEFTFNYLNDLFWELDAGSVASDDQGVERGACYGAWRGGFCRTEYWSSPLKSRPLGKTLKRLFPQLSSLSLHGQPDDELRPHAGQILLLLANDLDLAEVVLLFQVVVAAGQIRGLVQKLSARSLGRWA